MHPANEMAGCLEWRRMCPEALSQRYDPPYQRVLSQKEEACETRKITQDPKRCLRMNYENAHVLTTQKVEKNYHLPFEPATCRQHEEQLYWSVNILWLW